MGKGVPKIEKFFSIVQTFTFSVMLGPLIKNIPQFCVKIQNIEI